MANVPITAGSGTNIATNSITRDAVTEQMQLFNLADSVTAINASVTAAGTAGTNALAIQGHASGVALPISNSVLTGASGTIAIAGTGAAVSAAVANAGTATITIHGTYVAAFTFQLSDDNGTTWYNSLGVRLDGTGGDMITSTLTNASQGWQFGLGGVTNIRVYASTYTSGTANVKISLAGLLTDPSVYIGGGIVSLAQGGNTANVDSNNRLYAYQPDRTTSGTLVPSATANAVSLTGLSGYGQAVIAWPASSGSGNVSTEATVDGTNWFFVPVWSVQQNLAITAGGASYVNSANTLRLPIVGYQGIRLRCNVPGTNAGITVTITASSFVLVDPIQGSGTNIGTVTANMTQALPTGANTIGKVTSTNDATSTSAYSVAATTVVKASAGRLVSVLVTTQGTADVKIYDNASAASGTIIGYVPATATVGSILPFTAPAANGITVGGVAGNAAFTVLYT